jgi:ferredoxin-NADP reductase/multimeric flavodoxin WrbA
MSAIILNGAAGVGDPADQVALAIEARLAAQRLPTRHFVLREQAIGHCLGEFDCWVRTPGRCRIKDEGQNIERAVHDAETFILVSPVTFGGYSPELKKAIDRLIPLILPFFAKAADLTHHAHRYAKLPRMIGVGIDAKASPARAELFSAFVESNALNLGASSWGCAVLGEDEAHWQDPLDAAFAANAAPGNPSRSAEGAHAALLKAITADTVSPPFARAPHVALLVASARPAGASTSLAIAAYFTKQLEVAGATTEIVMASALARDAAHAQASAEVLAKADVLAVIAPLYVDALPYLGQLALVKTHAARKDANRPQRVIGIMNCGFPEPEHMRFAFASLRTFAGEIGATFAGGLSIAGGEVIHGQALEKVGGLTKPLRAALDASAVALAQGAAIPPEVSLSLARPIMPPMLYRMAGAMGWRFKATANGLHTADLRARPFDTLTDAQWQAEAASGRARNRPLRVVGKIQETADAVTVLFEDPAHDPLSYCAGQAITLDIEIAGLRVRRAYSLASIPQEPGLAITIKRVAGGLMSNYVHDHLHVGDLVRTFGPSGRFVAAPARTKRRLLLIGGGSGIVPLAAIARSILQAEADAQVTLIYGAASKARAIYAAALDQLTDVYTNNFHMHWVLESPNGATACTVGRLDEDGIGDLIDSLSIASFDQIMACGPDAMRASVRALLAARGVTADRILEESFASPRAGAASTEPQTAILVLQTGETRSVPVAPGQSLLDATLDAGEAISFSCMSGGCGACRVTIVEGLDAISLDEPNDVDAADRAAGRMPACLVRLNGPIRFSIDPP